MFIKKYLSSKLSRSYYALQSLKGITSVNILRSTYFTLKHSLLRCGILFWGGDGKSKKKNCWITEASYVMNLQHIKRYFLQGIV
jgi:hypothetical protein